MKQNKGTRTLEDAGLMAIVCTGKSQDSLLSLAQEWGKVSATRILSTKGATQLYRGCLRHVQVA